MAIPKAGIEWLVGKLNVSTPIDEVKAEFQQRCKKAKSTPTECRLIVNHAVKAHLKNRVQYMQVTSGAFKLSKAQRAAFMKAAKAMG